MGQQLPANKNLLLWQVWCLTEEAPDLQVTHFSNQKSVKLSVFTLMWSEEQHGIFFFYFFLNIIAANSNDVWNENSLSSLQRRFCCVQCKEAEMHNFRLGETARKTYHTQQDLKDFQTGTPGAWSFLSFLTVFNAQAPRLTSLCSQLAGACTKKFCFMQNTQSWKESPEDLYRYLEGKH